MYYNTSIKSYKISEDYLYIGDEDMRVLCACSWLVDNHATIKETANQWGFSSTTLWRRIHNNCKELSSELYEDVVKKLKENHLNGGQKNGQK